MFFVQLAEQLEPFLLLLRRAALRRMQIKNRIAAITKKRAFIGPWHVAIRPVRRAIDRATTVIGEDDEARQIFVFAAQTVSDPTPDARMTGEDAARIHLKERRAVSRSLGIHRANQSQIVGVFGDMRK